jgi:hypothetical protein
MQAPHYRYFIELQQSMGGDKPRALQAESRRATAREFIETVRDWLAEKNLAANVSELSVTMFGQVQIACDSSVIQLIRNRDSIAAIRQGSIYSDTMNRWH